MYHNADEIGKLQMIKADSDKEMLEALQQVKNLSDSNTALQQELDELKVAAQAVVDMVDIPGGEASEGTIVPSTVCVDNHSTVCVTCTRVGQVLLVADTT